MTSSSSLLTLGYMQTPSLRALHGLFCQEALALNYRPSTVRWWKGSLNTFLRHCGEDEPRQLSDLTPEGLRSYLYGKKLSGWTAHTFSSQYRALKAFLSWCVRRGHIESNPLTGLERPRLEKKLPKRITREEAERVLEHAFHSPSYEYRFLRYRNRAVFAVMLYAGLRASEVLGLGLADVEIANRTIFVRCGKGAKDRLVPMSAALASYLAEYAKDRQRLGKASTSFFTSLRGDKPFSYRGLTRVVNRIRRETGIDFSSHRLRHTFATLMLEGGCDLFSLQKMLGHSDIQTTTIYLSASAQLLRAQIAKHPMG
jgi:site-specific recombinase XerD